MPNESMSTNGDVPQRSYDKSLSLWVDASMRRLLRSITLIESAADSVEKISERGALMASRANDPQVCAEFEAFAKTAAQYAAVARGQAAVARQELQRLALRRPSAVEYNRSIVWDVPVG